MRLFGFEITARPHGEPAGAPMAFPDRDMSPVADQAGIFGNKRLKSALMVGAVFGVIGLLTVGIKSSINDKGIETRPQNIGATQIAQITSSPPPAVEPAPAPKPTPIVNPQPPPSAPAPAVVQPKYVMMPASSGELGFAVPPAPKSTQPTGAVASRDGRQGDDAVTKVAFKPSTIVGSKASQGLDLTYVMLPQKVPCVLDGAMDSQLPGSISCRTTADVMSPGHVPLLKQGTIITGVYKNDVGGGQNRLFAFAGQAIDPSSGIAVDLNNSGIADGYGITGIRGDVDHHYGERFGGAFLLLLAQTGASLGQTMLSKPGQTNLNIGSGDVTSLASDVLRNSINIPPTITVPPGTEINVVVDHMISFADSIKVMPR